MAFKIKKVKPMFTGIIVTATKYKGETTTRGGLIIDTTKLDGQLNPFQTVIAVGDMVKDIKEGDIVKLNFKRYAKARHVPGAIDEAENKQFDNLSISYEIPIVPINDVDYLFMQTNDVEYIVTDCEIDEGGLLQ